MFEKAAEQAGFQCAGIEGATAILDDLRERAKLLPEDPLQNRDLIIDPSIDAQILDVPLESIEIVCAELAKYGAVHVWARAHCPYEEPRAGVIIETDSSAEFLEALQGICPHCGQRHSDLTWDNVEPFYAINLSSTDGHFSWSSVCRLARPLPKPTSAGRWRWGPFDGFISRMGERAIAFFARGLGSR